MVISKKFMKYMKIKGDGKVFFKELYHHCHIMEHSKVDLESILKETNNFPELVFNYSFFFFDVNYLIGYYEDCIMCDLWIKKVS
jgi:hypothetical protein